MQRGKENRVDEVAAAVVRDVFGIIATIGDAHEELVIKRLVGNPRRLITRFVEGVDNRWLVVIKSRHFGCCTREHIRYADSSEIADSEDGIKRDNLVSPRHETR